MGLQEALQQTGIADTEENGVQYHLMVRETKPAYRRVFLTVQFASVVVREFCIETLAEFESHYPAAYNNQNWQPASAFIDSLQVACGDALFATKEQ